MTLSYGWLRCSEGCAGGGLRCTLESVSEEDELSRAQGEEQRRDEDSLHPCSFLLQSCVTNARVGSTSGPFIRGVAVQQQHNSSAQQQHRNSSVTGVRRKDFHRTVQLLLHSIQENTCKNRAECAYNQVQSYQMWSDAHWMI